MKELEARVANFLHLEKTLMYGRLDDFEELVSNDFVEFGTSGRIYSKEMQLDSVDTKGLAACPFIIKNFSVQQLAPTIVHITYQTETIDNGSQSNRSSIWKYEHEKWRLYFHQGTPTISF